MGFRRVAGATVVVAALVVALLTVGPVQATPPACQVQDVSGIWEGTFTGQVNQGEVTLFITQSHRRFHVTADANGAVLAEGDGTIAESGQSHFNGAGAMIKKINAQGTVEGDCFANSAQFSYTATYLDGTRDSGMVTLPVHFPAGGGD